MSYTARAIFSFGDDVTTSADLMVQPLTAAHVATGDPVVGTWTALGLGVFGWAGTVPDDALTGKGYSTSDATVLSVRAFVTSDSPGVTTLLGRVTAGRAAAWDNLDEPVSGARDAADAATQAAMDAEAAIDALPAPDNAGIAAIRAKTDALPESPASTSDVQPTIAFTPTINPTPVTVDGGYSTSDREAATARGQALAGLADKLAGMTSLPNWLRAMFRKSTPDATAASEIGGTYDPATDSLEAAADRAAGGSGGRTIRFEDKVIQ